MFVLDPLLPIWIDPVECRANLGGRVLKRRAARSKRAQIRDPIQNPSRYKIRRKIPAPIHFPQVHPLKSTSPRRKRLGDEQVNFAIAFVPARGVSR
jgi:hypothetical protein